MRLNSLGFGKKRIDLIRELFAAIALFEPPIPVALCHRRSVHSAFLILKLEVVLYGYYHEVAPIEKSKMTGNFFDSRSLFNGMCYRAVTYQYLHRFFRLRLND